MSLISKLLLWALLMALAVTGAKAGEPEPFRGIWCVSADKVERVVTLGQKLGGAQEGIIAVNKEAEGSCFYGTIVGVRQKAVNTIVNPDDGLLLEVTAWNITRVITIADFEKGVLIPLNVEVEEAVRFTLEGSQKQGV